MRGMVRGSIPLTLLGVTAERSEAYVLCSLFWSLKIGKVCYDKKWE